MHFRIVEVSDETVTMDANHPLAGRQVELDVSVEAVREAGPDELERAGQERESGPDGPA